MDSVSRHAEGTGAAARERQDGVPLSRAEEPKEPKSVSGEEPEAAAEGLEGLEGPLQEERLQVGRAADGEDGVGGAASLHQGGDGLAQLQVVKVTRSHALRGGHAGVDLHLGPNDAHIVMNIIT
ncbi:hypothetical protein EYF80_059707 [Liparis tanakae]|uniref:Uncharacterized protein n=1 Tax=Liparis tanakae TaxID=230148 RepID=A0A4Z2EP39_9TELE|nr:hypothetical protein EYF80_059707 [Liparis tanakae]